MSYLDSIVLDRDLPQIDCSLAFPAQPAPPGTNPIPSYSTNTNQHNNIGLEKPYFDHSLLSNCLEASLTAEIVRLKSENIRLKDDLKQANDKFDIILYGDKKRKYSDGNRKRKISGKLDDKCMQTKESYNPKEYNRLKFKCGVYKEQCLELQRKLKTLEESGSKTANKLKIKSEQLSTLNSEHEELKRSHAELAEEKENIELKFVALGRECVSAEQRQNGIIAAKETQLEQLGNETKQLSILLSEKTAEVNMLRHAALDKMKQKVQDDQQMTKLDQINKRLQKTNLQLIKENTELNEKVRKLEAQMEAIPNPKTQLLNEENSVSSRQKLGLEKAETHRHVCRCPELELNVSEMQDSVYRATNQLAQLQHTNASVVYENDLLRKKLTGKTFSANEKLAMLF